MELFNYAVILPFSLFVFSLEMQPFLMWCGSSLRHWATIRKVAVSIPHGVVEIFHWHNTSGRTISMGSTQPLKEMSTRNIFCGIKSARALGWQHYHFRVPTVMKSGRHNLQEESQPVQGCTRIAWILCTHFLSLCTIWVFLHYWSLY
jgi:hypothetical protein